MTITHILIKTPLAKHERLVAFYKKAFKPIGMTQLATLPNGFVGFGVENPEWFIGHGEQATVVHAAFGTKDRESVDAFHKAAIDAGATDNGAPGVRSNIHENYYAAFIYDPSGNNIEVGCMSPSE